MLSYNVCKVGLAGKEPAKPKISRMDLCLAKDKLRLATLNWAKIWISVGSLASEARLAQRMPQPIVLGSGMLGLAHDYQQKNWLSYLGLAIQHHLATGSSARGWVFILKRWTRLA